MEPDIAHLPPPSEDEFRWLERMAEGEDLFPGESGIVAYRMRMRFEASERRKLFLRPRGRLHKMQRPLVREAA